MHLFRHSLEAQGIKPRLITSLEASEIKRCEVLCFIYSDRYALLRRGSDEEDRYASSLFRLRERGHKIIIIDDHDTTGNIKPRFVDIAHVYAKAQLLKDRSLYLKPMYQKLFFKQYYHEALGLEENGAIFSEPLTAAQVAKLRLAWNYGLIDWGLRGLRRVPTYWHLYFMRDRFKVSLSRTPLDKRGIHVSLRIGSHDRSAIVHYHRAAALKPVQAISGRYTVRCGGKLTFAAYQAEMADSVVLPSPYGFGEVCYRDFETFESGGLLLKPTMEYIETWPSYYLADTTYIPYNLDYSDYEQKLAAILERPGRFQEIATEGQRRWHESLHDSAAFANQFRSIIDCALAAR